MHLSCFGLTQELKYPNADNTILKKLKIELPYDPAISTSGYLFKENKNANLKRYLHTPCALQHDL